MFKGQWVQWTSMWGQENKAVIEWIGEEYTRILVYEAGKDSKMKLERDLSVPNDQLTPLKAELLKSDLHVLVDASLALKDPVWFIELTDHLKGVRL